MANRISGMNSLNRLRPMESEQPKQTEKNAAEKSINKDAYDGMSGAERAEMQRFMNLKARAERSNDQGARTVRNLGPATSLMIDEERRGLSPDRAKEAFADFDLSHYENARLNELDERDPAVMERLPQSVRDSYQHYYDHAEANDWATVYISKHPLDGESVYMVATRTDGSDNYMELFDADGVALASGRAIENDPRDWDSTFGDCRSGVVYD